MTGMLACWGVLLTSWFIAGNVSATEARSLSASDRLEDGALISSCLGCHALAHEVPATAAAAIPPIPTGYSQLAASLRRYRTDSEANTVMHRLMAGYTDAEITTLARMLSRTSQ